MEIGGCVLRRVAHGEDPTTTNLNKNFHTAASLPATKTFITPSGVSPPPMLRPFCRTGRRLNKLLYRKGDFPLVPLAAVERQRTK